MGKIKIIPNDKDPKIADLPFGTEEAVEDYLDERWAENAIKEHEKENHHEYKTLDDLKALLSRKQQKS